MCMKSRPINGRSQLTRATNVVALPRSPAFADNTRRSSSPSSSSHVTELQEAREARASDDAAGIIDSELRRRAIQRFGNPSVRALRDLAFALVGERSTDPHDLLSLCANAASMPALWLRVGQSFIAELQRAEGGAA